jgi:hypothetical protein
MALAVESALAGKRVIWGAPTYDQVRIGWEEARRGCRGLVRFKETEKQAIFPGEGRIIYRSLDDPDNARGHTADVLFVDEAADVDERAWYEVLRPMLLDTNGTAWIGGTPKGRNWFWREYMAAQDRPDCATWNAPTLGVMITAQGLIRSAHPLENPNVQFSEIQQLYRTLPERVFRQEILAEFIEDAGGVFRGVAACVDTGRTENEPAHESYEYVIGIDLARVEDFTVVSVLDDMGRQVYLDRFNDISWKLQVAAIERAYKLYRGRCVVDATGVGDPLVEQLRDIGIPVDPVVINNANKNQMIDKLSVAIEDQKIRLMDVPVQTAELQAFQYELTSHRNIRMGAPQGMHDDTVLALALANSRCPYAHMDRAISDEDDSSDDEYISPNRAGLYY